tara:strand:+ start:1175 stop:1699 length:525 start_codon:yes stop_codon:yes gene_type:complete
MERRCITVSGLPGSGTTTISKALSNRISLGLYSSGEVFRTVASKMGLTLSELTELSEKEESIDLEIDEIALNKIKNGEHIIEGRLVGWLAYSNDISAFKIWIKAEENIRHERIILRDRNKEDKKMILNREKSELERYREYYDFDLKNTDIYDLILDSSNTEPRQIVEEIMKKYD